MDPLKRLAKDVKLPNLVVHHAPDSSGKLAKVFILLDHGLGGILVKQQVLGHWCGYVLAREGVEPESDITYMGRSLHDWHEVSVAFPHAELPDLDSNRWFGYESKLDFSPDLISELFKHIERYSL